MWQKQKELAAPLQQQLNTHRVLQDQLETFLKEEPLHVEYISTNNIFIGSLVLV